MEFRGFSLKELTESERTLYVDTFHAVLLTFLSSLVMGTWSNATSKSSVILMDRLQFLFLVRQI